MDWTQWTPRGREGGGLSRFPEMEGSMKTAALRFLEVRRLQLFQRICSFLYRYGLCVDGMRGWVEQQQHKQYVVKSKYCCTEKKGICLHLWLSVCVLINQSFCGSVVEHCISSAKGCGFNSQGTHILIKKRIARMHCKSLWIKASAKCINVSENCPKCGQFH